MAFQPLIVLAVPAVLFPAGWRRLPAFALRVVVPTVLLLALPVLKDPSDTLRSVVQQPIFPSLTRPTVWMHLAPTIVAQGTTQVRTVEAGPVRLLSAFLAVAIGLWYVRRAPRPSVLVWCLTVTLAFRYLLEPGVEPYDVWPAIAAGLIGTAVWRSWARLWSVATLAIGLTWLTNVRVHASWLWWPIAAGVLWYVALSAPPQLLASGRPDEELSDASDEGTALPSSVAAASDDP